MDKRSSWPWKKKSADKHVAEKAVTVPSDSSISLTDLGVAQVDKVKQDNAKKPKYVQISQESYAHLTGLEDVVKSYKEQVQNLEDRIKEMNGKLTVSKMELVDKENLVKQHAKVAEEAVSGWEKAEAEAAALKNHLESVTLLKLTAEDHASHLDGALKECMRQIRNLKDEHATKLHEVVLNKNLLFDKMKLQLEDKIANLDQELMRSAAESAALSRSLQERSNMLIQLRDEKSQAEAEIVLLRSNMESFEREVNSLKYELHIARKEVEIRNEETNMSVRSADAANKQHLEGVKKIAKLEAECQRLRGLVRKKLPGPAALAQMKLEVENLGREYGEPRVRRSPRRSPAPQFFQSTEFSLDNAQKYLKENELLTERLLAMEEETKMLKEALARRNSIYAETASKLQTLETQLQANGNLKNLLKSHTQVHGEGFDYKEASNVSSFVSASDDGNDNSASFIGSCSTVLISGISYSKKEKDIDSPQKSEAAHHLDLMDDFLEMEKLAYQSNECSGAISDADSEFVKKETSFEVIASTEPQYMEEQALEAQLSRKDRADVANLQLPDDPLFFTKLKSKVCTLLEILSDEKDMDKTAEDIRVAMVEVHDTLDHVLVSRVAEVIQSETDVASAEVQTINQEMEIAISQIYCFIMVLYKEAKTVLETSPDEDGLDKNLDMFSVKYSSPLANNVNLIDFVVDISHVLNKASELHFNILGLKSSEVDAASSDCIDKIALPENKAVANATGGRYHKGCTNFSDPGVSNDGDLVPTSETSSSSWKCSLQEFEQLKMDNDSLAGDLARCTENCESTMSHLLETEQLLADVKSQLAAAQKSNSLAETQLKCMAESYRSLESRAEELQTEVNLLQRKIDSLDTELQEERRSHHNAIDRCKRLQEQLERIDSHAATENDEATQYQEKELAVAAEKLAECQETIFLLGKQLKSLHPQIDSVSDERTQEEAFAVGELTKTGLDQLDIDKSQTETLTIPHFHRRAGSEATVSMDTSSAPFCSLDSEAKPPVGSNYHRPTKSISSISTPTPEKHGRGFIRFFSPKSKTSQ